MSAYLIDISRLVSRAGLGPLTGIDRVERAYVQALLERSEPVFGLCRLPRSYAILDRRALSDLLPYLSGAKPYGSPGLAAILFPRFSKARQAAIRHVYRKALTKVWHSRLKPAIQRHLPPGFVYLNVGHSNLRAEVFAALTCMQKIVFIHDVIPQSSPEFSTPEKHLAFQKMMQIVGREADKVIYNSQGTQEAAQKIFALSGRTPKAFVAHLGMDVAPVRISQASEKPSFHIVGTIEPRKNHRLLLDIWAEFSKTLPPEEIPDLHIIGRRGWKNADVFDILDQHPMMGRHVFEHANVNDDDLRKMLAQSWALLFPSKAEGFGLPLIEAAALGVPILCGENAIYREILGDYPLYLNVDNSYAWSQRILGRAGRTRESEADRQRRVRRVSIPDWPTHFDSIFRFIRQAPNRVGKGIGADG